VIDIITNTPFWVWALFIFLLYKGVIAIRKQIVSFKKLFIVPLIFLVWSFQGIVKRYPSANCLAIWLICILIGATIGYILTSRQKIRIDPDSHQVEMPGSMLPIVCSTIIFTFKYFVGVVSAIHPDQVGSTGLFICELFAAIFSGIFVGRTGLCVFRFSQILSDKSD